MCTSSSDWCLAVVSKYNLKKYLSILFTYIGTMTDKAIHSCTRLLTKLKITPLCFDGNESKSSIAQSKCGVSTSTGNLQLSAGADSSSDSCPPTPPARDSRSSSASSADDEDEEPRAVAERFVADVIRKAVRTAAIQRMKHIGLYGGCEPLHPTQQLNTTNK